jgi:hypothetical protein
MTAQLTDPLVIHKSPWSSWYADQQGRAVWIHDKTSSRKAKLEPPAEWGSHWQWNITVDGTGIFFRHVSG